jgi:hypothetical protein
MTRFAGVCRTDQSSFASSDRDAVESFSGGLDDVAVLSD